MITLTQPCAMPEEKLTSPQQTALSLLIVGRTVSEAASTAGVHHNTVHRWLKSDEQFQKARHQAQHEAQRTVEAKLHDTATVAMECIEECLQQGDAYVAEQLLKGLSCYNGTLKDVGSDEAVTLAQEALQHSALSERLERSDFGSRRSAQAGDYQLDDRYASVFSTQGDESTNPQPSATLNEDLSTSPPLALTSEFRPRFRNPLHHPMTATPT